MIRIFLDDETIFIDAPIKIALSKKFLNIKSNSMLKSQAIILKIGDQFYLATKVTIIKLNKETDIYIEGEYSLLKSTNKKEIKTNLKKIIQLNNFYERKFEIGLKPEEMENYVNIKMIFAKYNLLRIHNLSPIEERRDE
ncbi:MAG: hypothetical protein HRT99_01965 [Mycoplasmatales bacterium]|nr:hypothetical protein [Mycoplasmatales bacterium]